MCYECPHQCQMDVNWFEGLEDLFKSNFLCRPPLCECFDRPMVVVDHILHFFCSIEWMIASALRSKYWLSPIVCLVAPSVPRCLLGCWRFEFYAPCWIFFVPALPPYIELQRWLRYLKMICMWMELFLQLISLPIYTFLYSIVWLRHSTHFYFFYLHLVALI